MWTSVVCELGKPTQTLTELSKHAELPVADASLSFSVTNYLWIILEFPILLQVVNVFNAHDLDLI